jgi:ATP-binding cassette subfamily B protein
MRILLSYLKQYWKLCVGVLVLAVINQVFSLLDPLIFRHIIDEYATQSHLYGRAEFFQGVLKLLLLAVGVAFVSRVAKNFQDYYLNEVTARVGALLYGKGVQHSLELPYVVFEDQRSGETLGILQKVRTDVEKFIGLAINLAFMSLIGFIFVSIYALTIYWGIAAAYAATIPLIGGLSYFLTGKVKHIQKQIVAETTALAGSTTESLRNIELVKSLGLVEQEIGRLNATTEKILLLELKKLRYVRSVSFVQGTLINFIRSSILLFMLYLIFIGVITFGQFFSLFVYSFFVFGPLQELGNIVNTYREVEVSLKKYKSILEMPIESVPTDAKTVARVTDISFDHVSFSYPSGTQSALTDISFDVKAGETIAFVGPSGSGKTSLVKLLVGLYVPNTGTVSYNAVPYDHVDIQSIRNQIGFVTQDTQLFAGTIRENLLFVKPHATDAECLDVLQKSACDALLARGGKGLDTVIGEGGVKVSGGEKQRLSIARALLRTPHILIFDEATSALDSITEEEITHTVRNVTEHSDRITVSIAHRLSTIMHADRIYVLEKGHILEVGNHDTLLSLGGLYSAMWREQTGERA